MRPSPQSNIIHARHTSLDNNRNFINIDTSPNMSTQLKAIKLWGKGSTNPPKIAILLNELGLAHEVIEMSFPDLKKPEFLTINPNGRMPAIYDPNTDLTLWESGAIVEYLIEKYDTDQKLSFAPGSAESFHAKQWLFFQVSGQAPYFGQAAVSGYENIRKSSANRFILVVQQFPS